MSAGFCDRINHKINYYNKSLYASIQYTKLCCEFARRQTIIINNKKNEKGKILQKLADNFYIFATLLAIAIFSS